MTTTWNIFLLKDEVKTPLDALKEPNEPGTRQAPLKASTGLDGLLVMKEKPTARKPWLSFLSDLADIPIMTHQQNSLFALLILKVNGRFFAFAFGQGRHLLDQNKVVDDFGLRFVLNRLNVARIRAVETKTMAEEPLLVIRQLGTSGVLGAFDVDKGRDLLQRIQAKPKEADYAATFAGRNSLQIATEIPTKKLEPFCRDLLDGYQEDTYKQAFAWIDAVRPLADTRHIQELDDWLVNELRTKRHHGAKIVPPTLPAEQNDVLATFQFRKPYGTTTQPRAEPDFADYFIDISNPLAIDLQSLRRDHLQAHGEGDEFLDEWPVYKSLYVERKEGDASYILSNGVWVKVNDTFQNDLIVKIQAHVVVNQLPACNGLWDEGTYNIEAAKILGASCLDKKLITPPGEATTIELCDIFRPGCQLVHVKNYRGSAPLSHLFAQGRVSGTLLKRNGTVVDMLKDKVKAAGQGHQTHVRKPWKAEDVTVHYGIIAKPGFTIPGDLPIFAKVDLESAIERLTDLGYKVRVEAIPRP